jgi:hypothetical protein
VVVYPAISVWTSLTTKPIFMVLLRSGQWEMCET